MCILLSHLSVITDVNTGFNLLNPYDSVDLWSFFLEKTFSVTICVYEICCAQFIQQMGEPVIFKCS